MTLVLTIGDTLPLTGSIGTNAVGATGELHIKRPDGTVDSLPVSWTDADTGAWSADLVVGTQEGYHYLEVEVTFSSGDVQTFALDARNRETYFLVRDEYA